MQKIMLDVGLLEQNSLVEASARAGWGWLFLLRHCNVTANDGLISQATTEKQWARILPSDSSIEEIIEAGFVESDGNGNWCVMGYDLAAQSEWFARKRGGQMTAQKRWGSNGSSVNSSAKKESNGSRRTVRTPDRTPVRQPDRTLDRTLGRPSSRKPSIPPEREPGDDNEPIAETEVAME